METRKNSFAIRLLRSQSKDYDRYMYLKSYLRQVKKKLLEGKLGERGSFNYYVMKDEYKELKNKLMKDGLL